MALVINSNIASLATQRNLAETQKDSAVSLERLSSGVRINSARDDAAGIAIATRFSAQINGLTAAMRNANDGTSMLQTMDSALSEVSDNLQRMRELAVQAANGTNTAADRTALDAELQQLILEIDRVADGTSFNGNLLFTTATTSIDIQVGADDASTNSTNAVNIGSTSLIDARTSSLGTGATTSVATATLSLTTSQSGVDSGDVKVNDVDIGAVAKGGVTGSYSQNILNAITAADSDITGTIAATSLDMGAFTDFAAVASTTYNLTVGGVSLFTSSANTAVTAAEIDNAVNSKASELAAVGITFSGTAAAGGTNLTFARADGGNVVVSEEGAGGDLADAEGFASTTARLLDASGPVLTNGYGAITLTSDFNFTIQGVATNDENKIGATEGTYASTSGAGTALASTNITTTTNASSALTSIDSALNTVNVARSNIGANLSRLDSVSSNLASVIENYTAARSRVMDADFAVESANLARTQVLQQAGISVLAQANAMPQQVLALLQ